MLASLDKLGALPGETRVCCAHKYMVANLRFELAVEPDNAELATCEKHCRQLRNQGKPALYHQTGSPDPSFLHTCETDTMAAVHHLDASTHDVSTVFAALRQWKNQFK